MKANRVDGEPRGVLVLGESRVQLAHWDDGLWAIKCWPLPALPHGFQAHAGTRAEEETKKQEESLHGGTMVSVLAVLVIAILTVRWCEKKALCASVCGRLCVHIQIMYI